jgi:hypothetical protein
VDWAWPTKGAAWEQADPAAIDLFASALTAVWGEIARDQPDEPWKQALAASARRWCERRAATVTG